jgi:uncharacterized protein (TIGR03435 family)
MAWTKPKTVAVVVSVGVLIVLAVTVKWRFLPFIKDAYFKADYREFQKVPGNLLVVRPTHYSFPTKGTSISSYTRSPSGEYNMRQMGRNVPLERVIATAYQCNPSQIVSPPAKPPGNFDFLVTLPDKNQELFKSAIQKRLGYVAHWETRNTDVLLLEPQTPDPTALQPSSQGSANISYQNGRYEFTHARLGSVMGFLESGLKQPVLDRTGLTNFYDFSIARNWPIPGGPDQKDVEKILGTLGFKLEPGNAPVQMLVVEKIR